MPGLHIVDVIDYSSPNATVDDPQTDYGADWAFSYIISAYPDASVVIVQARDTLADVIRFITNTCQARGNMDLIRFNGHGHPGSLLHGTLTELTVDRDQSTLSRLRPYFNTGAEAYLLNCWVGQRSRLLIGLARAWNVPVSAATEQQLWGRDRSTVRFEGSTNTGTPDGRITPDRPGLPRDPNPHSNFQGPGPVRIP